MYVDNNGIQVQHNCEELVQWFEKFVVMAMNPGADLDSLPIIDNPDHFVVHAYASFIVELSYVATNNLSGENKRTIGRPKVNKLIMIHQLINESIHKYKKSKKEDSEL